MKLADLLGALANSKLLTMASVGFVKLPGAHRAIRALRPAQLPVRSGRPRDGVGLPRPAPGLATRPAPPADVALQAPALPQYRAGASQ